MDIPFLTIAALNRAYDRRELSPVEVTRALLDRIAALDGKLNSFIRVTEEVALAASGAWPSREIMTGRRRGPMHMVSPMASRDIPPPPPPPRRNRRHSDDGALEVAPASRTGRGRRDRPPPQGRRRRAARQAGDLGIRARWAKLRPALAAGAQPVGSRPVARGIVERPGRRRLGRFYAGGDRHRHRRLDPRPGGLLRHRRAETDLWQGQPARRLFPTRSLMDHHIGPG